MRGERLFRFVSINRGNVSKGTLQHWRRGGERLDANRLCLLFFYTLRTRSTNGVTFHRPRMWRVPPCPPSITATFSFSLRGGMVPASQYISWANGTCRHSHCPLRQGKTSLIQHHKRADSPLLASAAVGFNYNRVISRQTDVLHEKTFRRDG